MARLTITGTHQGEFMGIPATGQRVGIEAFDMWRLAGGKYAELRAQGDRLALMQQFGAIPAPGAGAQ